MKELAKKEIISRLQEKILLLEGYKAPSELAEKHVGLGPVEAAFPHGVFPRGVIHEFLTEKAEDAAACSGFIGGLLKSLMQSGSICLWIGVSRTIFPPALKGFGIDPDRIIFIDLQKEKDVLWVMEESLKCEGLAAVICELDVINFMQSRRLQLVVEKSGVTGFVLRKDISKLCTTACAARWKVTPLPSEPERGLPGVGFSRWNVELLKVRNGNPGHWKMEWSAGNFFYIPEPEFTSVSYQRQLAG